MIEGYLPGLVRVDPVGVAPAEVVALAARCERLEAVAEAAAEYREVDLQQPPDEEDDDVKDEWATRIVDAGLALDAALVAAGATGKAGT